MTIVWDVVESMGRQQFESPKSLFESFVLKMVSLHALMSWGVRHSGAKLDEWYAQVSCVQVVCLGVVTASQKVELFRNIFLLKKSIFDTFVMFVILHVRSGGPRALSCTSRGVYWTESPFLPFDRVVDIFACMH